MLRLFVGLALPEQIRQRLTLLCQGVPGARWVRPESLHLSLRFIGEVDEAQAEDIDAGLADIRAPEFAVTLDGVGRFGSGRRVRVLWAGVQAPDALHHLQAKVESAVVRAGCEPEGRRFTPHVTLARLKDAKVSKVGAFLEHNGAFQAGPFPVGGFVLFRSHLSQEGAYYEHVAEYPLEQTG